jgi:tetratricopeptide (TPR) repeat protein
MFFPRLRNQAKWAFVFLIVVFAGGFVFLGVGSGGLDLGQLLRDAFGNKGTSTGSVSKAQDAVAERPFNVIARRNLADVYERKNMIPEAITAWEAYLRLRPRDVNALRHVGQLELSQADRYLQDAQLAAFAQQQAGANSPFTPSSSSTLGRALGQDPIASAVSTRASTALQDASTKYQTMSTKAVATFERIVKLNPKDQQSVFALAQAADTLRNVPVAIRAYTRLLAFNLDPSTAAQIRARIKTLQQSTQGASAGG